MFLLVILRLQKLIYNFDIVLADDSDKTDALHLIQWM